MGIWACEHLGCPRFPIVTSEEKRVSGLSSCRGLSSVTEDDSPPNKAQNSNTRGVTMALSHGHKKTRNKKWGEFWRARLHSTTNELGRMKTEKSSTGGDEKPGFKNRKKKGRRIFMNRRFRCCL